MAAGDTISIRDNVGNALRFAREDWRLILAVAGLAAGAQGLAFLLGFNLFWIACVLIAVLAAHTALVGAALGLPRPFINRLSSDSARVGVAMTILGILCVIVFVTIAFVAMSLLLAPYGAEIKAAGEDSAAVQAVMERALQGQPQAISWMSILAAVVLFALTSRFYLAAPASIDRQRIVLFESWKMTRGNLVRIVGARLLLLGPAFIFVSALQALVAMVVGAPAGDPVALINFASSNRLGFGGFYTASIFLQIIFYSALEAGLSASFYRALTAAAATRASTDS